MLGNLKLLSSKGLKIQILTSLFANQMAFAGKDDQGDKGKGNKGGQSNQHGNQQCGGGNQGGNEGNGQDNGSGSGSGGQGNGNNNEQSSNKGKFSFKIVPLIFGDLDILTRTYNLTESETNKSNEEVILEFDNFSNGFKVIKQVDWNIGLGIAGILSHTSLPGVGVSIGLAPYAGSKVTFKNYVSDLKSLKNIERKIPFKSSRALSMKNGESVLFEQTGGLFFGVGIGAYGLGVGSKVVIEGNFKTKVERLLNSKVRVTVVSDSIKKASVHTGALIASISANKEAQLSDGISYIVDLNKEEGKKIYELMMSGDFTLAEIKSAANDNSSVTRVESVKTKLNTNLKRASIGIPFISLSNGSGITLEHSLTQNHLDGNLTESQYGIYQKSKNGQFVSKDREARFLWSYDDDHGTSRKMSKYLKTLRGKTGLSEFLNIVVQDEEKLGYSEINLNVALPGTYLEALLKTF